MDIAMPDLGIPSISLRQNRFGDRQLSQPERLAAYKEAVRCAIEALEHGRLRLWVPRLRGLRRKRVGQPFHATPELFLQQSGRTVFIMPEERFTVLPGEVCLMPRGVPHGEEVADNRRLYCNLVTMCHPNAYSLHHNFGGDTQTGWWTQTVDWFETPEMAKFTGCLDEIAQTVEAAGLKRPLEEPYVRGLVLTTLGWMQRLLLAPVAVTTPSHPLVNRCVDLIHANLAEPRLSVTWIAEQLGCTPDHLGRLMRRDRGRTVLDFIHERRIEQAKEHLTDIKLSIGEIAWVCGFGTQSYFNRVFLAMTGGTPGGYRKALANQN